MKNKTIATALALFVGLLGVHRWYLYGLKDKWAWVFPILSGLGVYGIWRANHYGLDDTLSWFLIPLGGFLASACCLSAIVYGLTEKEKWNAKFNTDADVAEPSGSTNWFTILLVCAALLIGTTVLMTSLVLTFERYFEYQTQEARKISQ